MRKILSDPVKAGKELAEKILLHCESEDSPGPRFAVCAAMQHLSAQINWSFHINSMDPIMLAYFGAANGRDETVIKLLRLAYAKAWILHDKAAIKLLKPYYAMFKDDLTDFLRSTPCRHDCEEVLEKAEKEGNLYWQGLYRYKACLCYSNLFELRFMDCLPFELDWLGAWFCHFVRVHRPDMEQAVMEILPRHPGFIGHLAEIGDEYREF